MLEITVLASGSSGNSLLVRYQETMVLVDAGLSAKQLQSRLAACGHAVEDLTGILLTHEHGDHTSALKVLCSRFQVPIFCNSLTAQALQHSHLDGRQNWKKFTTGSCFSIGELEVEAFSVPHDAADPVGFVIRNQSEAFGILTDLGHANASILDRMRQTDAFLIEANHDEQLLQNDTRRPWSIKQRILSRHGHLSNSAAAHIVAQLAEERLKQVILGHLSQDCNRAELAVREISNKIPGGDLQILCVEQEKDFVPRTMRVGGNPKPQNGFEPEPFFPGFFD